MKIQFLSRRNHFRLLCKELSKHNIDCDVIDNTKSRNFYAYPSSDYVNSINSDLIVSHNPYHGLRGAKLAKRKGKVQHIAFRLKADHWTEQKSSKSSLKNKLGYALKKPQYRNSIDEVSFVIAISEYMKKTAEKNGLNKPIYVMYNGVDTQRFHERETDTRFKSEVLCVMNFEVLEKILLFEKVLKKYGEKGLDYKLTVLGDGLYLNRIKKIVKNNGLSDNVLFKGHVNDVEYYYSNCDVLLHPSNLESFGMSLLEAGASGKPCVVSNIGAIPEIIVDNKTGYVSDTVEGMIERVNSLMGDAETRLRMGANAKKRILKKFTWKKVAPSFLTILNAEGLLER